MISKYYWMTVNQKDYEVEWVDHGNDVHSLVINKYIDQNALDMVWWVVQLDIDSATFDYANRVNNRPAVLD